MRLMNNIDCTGCGACTNICQQEAIKLSFNEYGFLQSVRDPSKCVGCNRCVDVCKSRDNLGLNRSSVPKVYAAWTKCASGNSAGLFLTFARAWIQRGGVVVAPVFTDSFDLIHDVAVTEQQLLKQAWSKFAQSHPGNSYKKIQDYLSQEKEVLFIGSPCQIKGLYSFLGGDNKLLTTIQFPCMGTPPQKFLKDYIDWLSGGKLKDVQEFRGEVTIDGYGPQRYMACTMKDGKNFLEAASESFFVHAWNEALVIADHCLKCTDNLFPMCADFTWGNFWYLGTVNRFSEQKFAPHGKISMLIVNSEKGTEKLSLINDQITLFERTCQEAKTGHFMFQTSWVNHIIMRRFIGTERRENFRRDWYTLPFHLLREKYSVANKKVHAHPFKVSNLLPKRFKGYVWRLIYYIQIIIERNCS